MRLSHQERELMLTKFCATVPERLKNELLRTERFPERLDSDVLRVAKLPESEAI